MTVADNSDLRRKLARIEEAIESACRRAGRRRREIELMAVTKMQDTQAIADVAALGISLFGENRVQEFEQKRDELRRLGWNIEGPVGEQTTEQTGKQMLERIGEQTGEQTMEQPGERGLRFRLIGHLQTNKSARAAEIFSGIDTLDSLRLAHRLDDHAQRLDRRLPVLIEIKLGGEASKTGIEPDSPALGELLDQIPKFRRLELRGLMTVPPYSDDPAAARPYFRELSRLRDRLSAAHPGLDLGQLSMGMSHDFAVAIEEGATTVRIGTALFGRRPRAKEE